MPRLMISFFTAGLFATVAPVAASAQSQLAKLPDGLGKDTVEVLQVRRGHILERRYNAHVFT